MKQYEGLGKKTLVEITTEELLAAIASGKYKIGQKLPNEYELIKELNVSRTSIREAMKILSAMGIVEIRRGDGTYVYSHMSPSIFDNVVYRLASMMSTGDELVELRMMLDELTIRTAIDKITEEEISHLKANLKQMKEALKQGRLDHFQKLDYLFHMILIDSCKNTFLSRIIKGIYSIYVKSMNENVKKEKIDTKAVYYHNRILECITNKDKEKVKTVVEESLSTWKKTINNIGE